MTTIGEAISRVRNTLKAVKEDPFLTDRTIYYSLMKYGSSLIKREDNKGKLYSMPGLFTTLSFVELIEVDKIEAECTGIFSGCIIKRTKDKLPDITVASGGPLIRSVTSIDGSVDLQETLPTLYKTITKSSTFKYNKTMYYWYINGYLYLPQVQWDAIKIDAIFEGDTSAYNCDTENECITRQEEQLAIPEYLFSEIEQFVIKELTISIQIPTNGSDDSQNVLR